VLAWHKVDVPPQIDDTAKKMLDNDAIAAHDEILITLLRCKQCVGAEVLGLDPRPVPAVCLIAVNVEATLVATQLCRHPCHNR
jgi:hypothetical protein